MTRGDGGTAEVVEEGDVVVGGVIRSRFDWLAKSFWDVKMLFGSGFMKEA
jgi:hypothetical protein